MSQSNQDRVDVQECPTCLGRHGHHSMSCPELLASDSKVDTGKGSACPSCGVVEGMVHDSSCDFLKCDGVDDVDLGIDPLQKSMSQDEIADAFAKADKLFGRPALGVGLGGERDPAEGSNELPPADARGFDTVTSVHLGVDTEVDFDEQKIPPDVDNIVSTDFLWLIAKLCHEVNRVYCRSIADHSQSAWEDAPEWQRQSAFNGVVMHFENPEATAEDSHRSWLADKVAEGWVYAPVKNTDDREHPCMLPYNQLPPAQKHKDELFSTICKTMFGG